LQPKTAQEADRKRTASASEVYREIILQELSRGRNAMGTLASDGRSLQIGKSGFSYE